MTKGEIEDRNRIERRNLLDKKSRPSISEAENQSNIAETSEKEFKICSSESLSKEDKPNDSENFDEEDLYDALETTKNKDRTDSSKKVHKEEKLNDSEDIDKEKIEEKPIESETVHTNDELDDSDIVKEDDASDVPEKSEKESMSDMAEVDIEFVPDLQIPDWVIPAFESINIAVLEANSLSSRLILEDFVGHRGFDVNEEAIECSIEKNPAKQTNLDHREFEGTLSTLSWEGILSPEYVDNSKSKPKISFGSGRARLLFNNETVLIESASNMTAGFTKSEAYHCVRLYANNANTLRDFVSNVLQWAECRSSPMHIDGYYSLWMLDFLDSEARMKFNGMRVARRLSDVILTNGLEKDIEKDVREFVSKDAEDWYKSQGIPHRRTLLFYGPQGTGKCTMAGALASTLKMNLCYVELEKRSTANSLEPALRNLPRPCIVLIKDVERIFPNSLGEEWGNFEHALQGIAAVEDVLIILTTDNIDAIDPNLLQSNRLNRRFEFKNPSPKEVTKLFLSYYPGAPKEIAEKFSAKVFEISEKEARTMATLQEHFIFTRSKSAAECVDMLDEFYKIYFPDGSREERLSIYL